MRKFKKFLNEDSSEEQWNQADKFLIDTLNLTSELTKKQVKSKILNFLKQQYNGKVSVGRIKMFAEDFTESICLKLDIEDNSIKESLIGSIKPKFVVGDIIRHKDYPGSQGIQIQRIDYEREAYEGVPPSWIGTDMERSLSSRYAFFKNQDDYDLIGGPSYDEDYEDLVMNSVGESKLYNKIMRNVDKQVKKAINEEYDDKYGLSTEVPGLIHTMTLDIYEMNGDYVIDIYDSSYKDKRIKRKFNISKNQWEVTDPDSYGVDTRIMDSDYRKVLKQLDKIVTEKLAKSRNYRYSELSRSWLNPRDYPKISSDIKHVK